MNAREWLNVYHILHSIDEVPNLPAVTRDDAGPADLLLLQHSFRVDPVKFLRRSNEATQACIWAEVTRRLAGGA